MMNKEIDHIELKNQYGRLKGIKEYVDGARTLYEENKKDYNNTVNIISKLIDENLSSYSVDEDVNVRFFPGKMKSKLIQFISYLEYKFELGEKVIEIANLIKAIKDEELRSRCVDMLTARSNFDRVINQATLVLEDRIRIKSKIKDSLVGVALINKVLNADLSKTILKISDDSEEHEGICHICRGIILAFRNPTHHYIVDTYSREDALKFCGFIDNLLLLIDKAKTNKA